jgi:vacuolar-type H+-ATPase subunit I/STV1
MANIKFKQLNEADYVVIDPRGNSRPAGNKIQASQYVKKMGGGKKGYFMILKKNALKARRALEKARGNYNDPKFKEKMSDMYWEGKLNETTAKDTLANAVNALTKTFGGKKIDKRYVKEYLKSIEQMARKKPMDFVKDYGDFDVKDWIEDAEYNLQNEGKLKENKMIKFKDILKEAAWDHTSGKALPTLEDVQKAYEAKKHLQEESPIEEGDNTQYAWGQINKALMKYGMSPRHIGDFLLILKKI